MVFLPVNALSTHLIRCTVVKILNTSAHENYLPSPLENETGFVIAARMPLTKKGSFSYTQDTVNFVAINNNLRVKIERINNAIARVSLVNAQSQEVALPANIHMQQNDGAPNPPAFNGFLISWVDSYTLFVGEEPYMELNNQKQQSISAPRNAASWAIT